MKNFKKLTSFILALVMIVGILPLNAFATGEELIEENQAQKEYLYDKHEVESATEDSTVFNWAKHQIRVIPEKPSEEKWASVHDNTLDTPEKIENFEYLHKSDPKVRNIQVNHRADGTMWVTYERLYTTKYEPAKKSEAAEMTLSK